VVRRAALLCAAVLAGCGGSDGSEAAERYESLSALEQARLFTYQAGAAAGYPEARAALPLQRRTVQEVNRIVEDLGRTPAFEAERTSDVDRVLPGLGDVRSRTDFVRFADELEAVAKAARAELPPAIP
jgi:hypothetical protein